MLSLMVYSLTSIMVSAVVVLYAVATRIRFYPIMVFLFTSKIASVTMINLTVVFTVLFGVGCVRLFLGRLRDAEMTAVWEHLGISAVETTFALTTFRDELNTRVGILWGIMLFARVFQVLNEARVEHVEQAHQTTWKAHARMIGLSFCLFVLNSVVVTGCVLHLSTYGPSVYLLFAFEHAVLLINLCATICRYAIAMYDLNFVNGRWHNKSQYEMYVALVSDALQFTAYSVFAGVVFTYYGLPIHLMRTLFYTFKHLIERVTHFIHYRRIMNSLNERFPDATEEELNATDRVCIVCREDMEPGGPAGAPKKLTCGHIFHSVCLQNWLERQFSCPTCRRPVPVAAPPPQPQAAAGVPAQPAPAQANPPAEGEPAAPQRQDAGEPPQQPAARINEEAARQDQGQGGAAGARAGGGAADRLRASLDRRFPAGNVGGEEEEKAGEDLTPKTNPAPLSPPLTKRNARNAADSDPVLFEDLEGEKAVDERLNARLRLLELEERVYQAQAQAAREAQEFALKVLQLQMQQDSR